VSYRKLVHTKFLENCNVLYASEVLIFKDLATQDLHSSFVHPIQILTAHVKEDKSRS
jgi:hypothetical protein